VITQTYTFPVASNKKLQAQERQSVKKENHIKENQRSYITNK